MTCHSSGCTTKSAANVRDALSAMVAPTVAPEGDGGSGLTPAKVPSIFMLPFSLVARSSVGSGAGRVHLTWVKVGQLVCQHADEAGSQRGWSVRT